MPLSLAALPDSSAEVDPDPVVLVGAGDIAGCGPQNDDETAALLDGIPGTVFTLGDHAYPNATAQKFAACYGPSWGRHKSRTRPSAGDHDYTTSGASAYFDYFGSLAGNVGQGYYSYDLGTWHVIVLNSNCLEVGGCGSDSPQGQWLQADLASNPSTCTLAYWHHARFSSGNQGSSASAGDFFQMLYDAGTDVVLNGHDHDYERFAPQDPDGSLDPAHGIRQFVVGTGGAPLQPFASVQPNSEVRNADTHGVLKLTLHPTSYEWNFVSIAGMSFTDSGSGDCIDARQPPATTISAPNHGSILMVGEPVSFVGEAIDPEDGDLTGSLTWTSDRDGVVGTGGAFSTTVLSAGTHEISATATNSGGLSGVAQIAITVTAAAGETTFAEASVGSSSDDAEESATGSVALGSHDLDLVHDQESGTTQTIGIRFPQVGIPRGANVSEAYVQFQASGISTGPGSLVIEGEAVDYASTFDSSTTNVSSRPRTSASVSWSPPGWLTLGEAGVDQRTPDIASVLEEIVSRPGWQSGHSLSLIITGTGTRVARAYDGDPMSAPSLHVSYQSLLFTDRVLTSDLVTDNRFYVACDTITLGPDFHIVGPGAVVFRAGSRIIIENGFSVGSGAWVSMQLDPTCTVDTLPLVTIDTPPDGSSFDLGDPVDFVGVAADEEDGDLTPRLSWTSDRDGSIGSGGVVSVTGLSSGPHRITARADDDGGLVGSDQITIMVYDTPPSVSIMAPSEGSSFEIGTAIDFAGTASDPEDGDLTESLTWVSDLNGSFGSGGSFTTSTLSPGPHTITASVTDSVGLTATDQITLQVFTSTPPGVSITSPTSGASFDFGEGIDFSGTASDLEDGDLTAAVSWTSDVDGEIGAGGSFTHAALSLGQHTITASVTDSEGLTGSDQIILTVNNTPPTVAISLPVDGASFDFGEGIDFSGTASDLEDGDLTAAVSWTSDLDGEVGAGGSFTHAALSLGQHRITASVTDSHGTTGSDQITLTVNNTPPTVAISLPVDGASFDFGDNVDFSGTASDIEDGDLTAAVSWASDLDGEIGMGGLFTHSALSPGQHSITASVTDSEGLTGSDQIILTVNNTPPTVAISLPVDGASFDFGEGIGFSGTASDFEDGDLTAAVSWTSDLDGEVGAGGSFTHAALSPGQHTITASVTDGQGLTGSDEITLTVNNTPPTVAISLPVDGASFDFGENVDFEGTASDMEDGDLTASLVWESDLDGTLGTGGSLSTTTLSSGIHTITASAVDGGGLIGEAQVDVVVGQPGTMTVNVRVVSRSDDGEEDPTGFTTVASSDLELVEDAATQTVGIRFDGVDVPREAEISKAYVQFQVDEVGSAPTLLVIEGESVDHSLTFVESNGNISTRPRTVASVLWSPPAWTTVGGAGSGQQTPDLSSVVQEVVSRPGWSSGNALSIILTGTGKRTAEAYDGAQAGAPLLRIQYRVLGETLPPSVTIAAPANGTTFEIGETIVFSGTAADPEDGDLSAALSWESDLDGVIGTGGFFTRSDLSEGVHTVTATAVDTDGLAGSDQTVVSVSQGGIVLVGAGDIATCSSQNDEATATLLDGISGTVFTLGDHAYPDGTAQEFADCYDPTWGRHKWRTRPSTGNHDYNTAGASAYFDYFGAAAGNPGEGYYSYDLGSWHIIALNSNCSDIGGCDPGSPQGQWLQADLAANPSTCTLAYWHHARFSSGQHGNGTAAVDLFEMLYDGGADVVLTAHDHDYERFAPQDPNGNLDETRGIRQFVVGTGGASLREFGTVEPNSEVRYKDSHGVLKLTLHPTSYEWEFVPVAGSTFTDTGTGSCVVAP